MRIRKATIRNAGDLAELDSLAWREIKTWSLQSKQDFEKSLRKKRFYFLIASEDEKKIGYLEFEYDKEKDAVWIKNIYVLKEYRKNNIAKQLIKKYCDNWKNMTNLIILLTADKNVRIFEELEFNKTMNYMVKEIR